MIGLTTGGTMPSIPISNGLSVIAAAEPAPFSTLARHALELPKLVASGAGLSRWEGLTLADPAIHSLDLGLAIERPIALSGDAASLTLGGNSAVHFAVLTGSMFSPDVF